MKNTVTISYRKSNLWRNLVHRFPTVTSHYLGLHLLTLMGDHYADRRQHSRVHYWSAKSHTWDFVICPPCVCCNIVNISAGDFCSKTQNVISVCCSVTDIFNGDAISRVLKKQTITIMPSEVMKWRSYFWDDAMSGANLWYKISFMQQFLEIILVISRKLWSYWVHQKTLER